MKELEEERKKKKRLEAEIEKQFNERLKREREKWNREKQQLLKQCGFHPSPFTRFQVFLTHTMVVLEEIQGGREELSDEERKNLVEQLKKVKALSELTIEVLTERLHFEGVEESRAARYDHDYEGDYYGDKGNGAHDEIEEFLEDVLAEEEEKEEILF